MFIWRLVPILSLLMLPASAVSSAAFEFEPITAQERALTQVSWQPVAPAVVLFEKAELRFMRFPREAWQEWLAEAFQGFDVAGVEVSESLDERQLRVGWSVVQRDEEVLGDEASLSPSLPLGPVGQPFTLPPGYRRTPVQFAFADRDQVELSLSWPEGWEVAALPEAARFQSSAGELVAGVELDQAGRHLIYTRRFDLFHRELTARELYAEVRDLFGAVESHDAQGMVLVNAGP